MKKTKEDGSRTEEEVLKRKVEEEVLRRKVEEEVLGKNGNRIEKPEDKECGNGTEEESLMMNSTLKTTIKITLLMIIMNELRKECLKEWKERNY